MVVHIKNIFLENFLEKSNCQKQDSGNPLLSLLPD